MWEPPTHSLEGVSALPEVPGHHTPAASLKAALSPSWKAPGLRFPEPLRECPGR